MFQVCVLPHIDSSVTDWFQFFSKISMGVLDKGSCVSVSGSLAGGCFGMFLGEIVGCFIPSNYYYYLFHSIYNIIYSKYLKQKTIYNKFWPIHFPK